MRDKDRETQTERQLSKQDFNTQTQNTPFVFYYNEMTQTNFQYNGNIMIPKTAINRSNCNTCLCFENKVLRTTVQQVNGFSVSDPETETNSTRQLSYCVIKNYAVQKSIITECHK